MIPVHHRRRRLTPQLPLGAHNFLSVLEGIEGGFAIATGLVAGLSFQTLDRRLLLITATIGILVNGFNASAVKYTSEHYDDELDGREERSKFKRYFVPAALEFIAYLLICALIVLPLGLIDSLQLGVWLYILLTLITLFLAGYYRGRLLKTKPVRDGFELASSGLLIVIIGATAGWLLSLQVVIP